MRATPIISGQPINGVIDPQFDSDYFVFEAQAGYFATAEVFAQKEGSPLVAILALYNERGEQIAWSEGWWGRDPYIDIQWEGAWVFAHTDCELILPPPSQNKGRGTRGEGRVAKGNGWSMRLQASVNGSVGEAALGIANGTRGLAVGLPPEPPTGNKGVQVILLKNNTPLAVDVRNDGSRRQEWEVLVRWDKGQVTRGRGERKEVTLTFDGIGYAPKDVSAWLVDTVTGKRLYLRTQPSYRFVAQEGEVERKFKVVVERGNDRPLRVVGLKATPMRGQGVVIEFSLTKPAKVEAEVLTLTGRKVAVLDAGSSEGLTRRVVWRGVGIEGQKVGGGVYLIRVRAIDDEGRSTQGMTIVRTR